MIEQTLGEVVRPGHAVIVSKAYMQILVKIKPVADTVFRLLLTITNLLSRMRN